MNIEQEVSAFYAGQALLEAALEAQVEYLALEKQYKAIFENLGDCVHPPLNDG